ncbi:hypothetical protein LTS18_009762 [Coniosporium uncinatum]|uniref:Uncharacterized protein n=1 Tax=Coniosporium uncinatum TaxID=93489 RepID=A0ACC3DXE2_9PEZI|nr:hypothetical protein LTS18_009762 [Coniosporium uncinatum]
MQLFISSLLGLSLLPFGAFAVSTNAHVRRQAFTVGQAVRTTSGTVIGHTARERAEVSEYLGIPFAQPPLGNLRFAAPQAFTGSANITADSYSPYLTQVGNTFDEDCLTLNIWTKPQTGERAKAVLFWIYGGGKYLDDQRNR